MSEDERLELLGSITEAHAALSEAAFKLRRELTRKAPVTKAAVKAEQEAFRLRRELQRLDLADPDPAERSGPLAEVRRGGNVVDNRAIAVLPVPQHAKLVDWEVATQACLRLRLDVNVLDPPLQPRAGPMVSFAERNDLPAQLVAVI